MKQKDEKKRGVKERKPNYKEYRASVEDIQTFLMGKVLLRHNVITRRVEYRYPSEVSGETTEWQPMNDRVVNTLWAELSLQKQVSAQDVYRVMDSDFVPDFHPFRSYLEHLPPWNGEDDHLLAMSMTVQVKGGTDEQLRFAEYLKKWLVAMVAGWIDPQVVNNVILVLIGAQGSYKTTWFNYLLPPELRQYFYTKTNASRMGRDDLLTLAQYGLVCCEELDTMRPSELNQLKAAVTMPTIDEPSSSATLRATAAGCPSRWTASCRRAVIPSTTKTFTPRRMPSTARASSTGSRSRTSSSWRSITSSSRLRR